MSPAPAKLSENVSPVITVLLVSPSERDRAVIHEVFAESGVKLFVTFDYEAAFWLLVREPVAVVICESEFRGGNWKVLLKAYEALPCPPRLIVSSRLNDERLWADVLQLGGYDVLLTPLKASEVLRSVSLAGHSWLCQRRSVIAPHKDQLSAATGAAGS